jgi:glycosyltransferase involved in cell wall biosynthesis
MRVLVVTNMYPTPDTPTLGSFVRDQVESIRKEGVDVDIFFVNGRKNRLNYFWAIFRLWAWLLTHRYDLIHAHYVFSGIIARSQFLYPVVLTHHGHEVFMTWERIPSRIITPLVDRVILVSEEQKEKLGCKRAEVIPCGIDFDLFRPLPREEARRKLSLPSEKKFVLWAGEYFRREKRFDIAEAAINLAHKKDPSIELLPVVGQPHHMMPVYMNACDVLLLISDGEGSPMVIKEAMACNLPIVSVPVGDVPNVIAGTDGCYLCSKKPSDIVEKLGLALSHPRRTNGRQMIGHMEQGIIARRIIAVYEQLLREKTTKSKHRSYSTAEDR